VTQYIEDTVETVQIPASLLVDGNNLIAVEIHQSASNSSDISMNLSLSANRTTEATPLTLTGTGPRTLRFRAKQGSTWSALAESVYQVGTLTPTPTTLLVSEISYFPPAPHGEAEFIELFNAGNSSLDLGGAKFTSGVDFAFPQGTTLAAGGRILVVRNQTAFELLYGTGKPIAGEFANDTALSNTGERLRLETSDGATLLDFSYGTSFPWPDAANGLGHSMVLSSNADPSSPQLWRPSVSTFGTPGTSDAFARLPGQSLTDYALASPTPDYNPASHTISIRRRLGADAVKLTAESSRDCVQWSSTSLQRIAETTDGSGISTLTWKLDPAPEDRAFIRIRIAE
jgi:hypothetical protein